MQEKKILFFTFLFLREKEKLMKILNSLSENEKVLKIFWFEGGNPLEGNLMFALKEGDEYY